MWKMPNKKHSNFLELLYKKKGKFPIYCFFDELDVDLFRKTYSNKKFSFELRIEYHSFKLTAELHLTRKEMLFILEKLKLIKKSYDNLSKTLFILFPNLSKLPSKVPFIPPFS